MTGANPLGARDFLFLVAIDRVSDTTLVLLESDFLRVCRSVLIYELIDLIGVSAC